MTKTTIKVLLIEDSAGDARLLQVLLEEEVEKGSVEIERVSWLAAALERLQTGTIDVVLADLSLPDSFGADTIARIRTQAPDVPVLALSGLDDPAMSERAKAAGARGYLVKGRIDRASLVEVIRQAVE